MVIDVCSEAGAFRLRTDRLTLRWLTLDDAGLMLAVWNDPAFVRFVGDRGIRTVEQAQQTMRERVLSQYENRGFGPYRVALANAEDTPVGICGLFCREHLDDVDIGFALLPEFRGKGYAFEAAQSVTAHAGGVLGLDRLTAIVSPDNVASVRLIGKVGMEFERMHRMPDEDHDVAIYSMALPVQGDR